MTPTSTKKTIVITIAAIFIAGLAYWAYYTHDTLQTLKNTQNEFASSTADFQLKIGRLEDQLAEEKIENENLSSVLSEEQKKSLELEKEKRSNEKKINTLTKLTTIDPELLKKYSKVYFLSENYVPPELDDIDKEFLIDPTKDIQILENVSPILEEMLEDANANGIPLRVLSAYRSFEYQKTLKAEYKVIYGAGTANQFSAEQGYSEHQLGTAVDFTTLELREASVEFEKTPAFEWLRDNAHKYGFILSYPKGNAFYTYEPWHWRFVGEDLAEDLEDSGRYFYEIDQREIDEYLIKIFD